MTKAAHLGLLALFLDYVNKNFVPTFKEKYNSDNEAFSDFENANFDDELNYVDNHSVILNIGMFDCQIIQVFQKVKNIADL